MRLLILSKGWGCLLCLLGKVEEWVGVGFVVVYEIVRFEWDMECALCLCYIPWLCM